MESIELKLREISNPRFPVVYTKKVIEILGDPELSVEVKAGQICEDVTQLLESLGYRIGSKKAIDGWILMKAGKEKKK